MHIERRVVQYCPGTNNIVKKELADDLDIHHVLGVEFSLVDKKKTITFEVDIDPDGLHIKAIGGDCDQMVIKPISGNAILLNVHDSST